MKRLRFLFTVWPIPGHYYPNIAIAKALAARGHDAAFYTGSGAHAVIAPEGFACFAFADVDEEQLYRLLFEDYRSRPAWQKPFWYQEMMRKWLVETIPQQVADIRDVTEEWKPDLVITDPTFWGPVLVLPELCGMQVVLSSFVPCCMLAGPDAPPFGLGLPSPRTWYFSLLGSVVQKLTDVYGRGFRKAADRVRLQFGLPPLDVSVTEFTRTLPLYLVPSSREFDYMRRDIPDSVRYVGPCLWNAPGGAQQSAWLEELRADVPWVHVSEGTIHVDRPLLLQAAARGLGGLPMQVIMTTGGNRRPEDLAIGPLASNVVLKSWVSHSDLLPRLDLMVTTGGAGTVLASLQAGVPLIIVPTEWDKPEIAQRVVEAGAGLRIAPGRCTASRLRDAVQRVLSDPEYRRNARAIQSSFARLGGAEEAARILEDFCLCGDPGAQAGQGF